MKITNVKFFKVPFEYKSQDRIVENVDVKLEKFFVEEHAPESDQIAWNYTDEISGSFTLTSNTPVNYMRVESDLFDKPVYYFLDTVEAIESGNAKKYSMKLDVMASFGEEVFTKLNNKEVNIERMHEDRFNINGDNAEINLNSHFLINSDFKLPTTKGAKKIYKGSGAVIYSQSQQNKQNDDTKGTWIIDQYNVFFNKWYDKNSVEITSGTPTGDGIEIRNHIGSSNTDALGKTTAKEYYVYAILNPQGEPKMNNNFQIAPVAINADRNVIKPNDLSSFMSLQGNKVISIILSPFPYDYSYKKNSNGVAQPYVNGHLFGDTPANNGQYIYTYSQWESAPTSHFPWTMSESKELIFIKPSDSSWNALKALVEKKGLTKFNIMDIFKPTLLKFEVQNYLNKTKYEELKGIELGLLNEDICPIYANLGQNDEIKIDMFNMLKDDLPYIGGHFDFSPNGVGIELAISNEQYVKFIYSKTIGFSTDLGKEYLARNKASMEAQMTGARLNADLQQRQITTGQYSRFGGGPVGGFMNTVNPMNWHANASDNIQADIVEDIATNEKNKIIAQANDMAATSSSYNMSQGDEYGDMISNQFKYKFNWYMVLPNEVILRNIYYFMQKSGYLIQDWLEFKEEIWKSREKWNYLQIKNVRDYLDIDQSDSIMDMIEDRLDKGVRIWHEDDLNIEYTQNNFEIKLINFANS